MNLEMSVWSLKAKPGQQIGRTRVAFLDLEYRISAVKSLMSLNSQLLSRLLHIPHWRQMAHHNTPRLPALFFLYINSCIMFFVLVLFDVVCVKAFVFSQWQWLFFLLARFGIKVWQLGQAGGPTETARASMGSRGEMELDSWARLDAQGAQEFTRKIQKCYCSSDRMASQTITIGRNTPRKRMQCTDTDSRWLKCIYS